MVDARPRPFANADRHAANVLPIIAEIQKSGAKTLRAIADALNARGIPTPRGRMWEAMRSRTRWRGVTPSFRGPHPYRSSSRATERRESL